MFIVKFKINIYNNKNNDRKMLVLLTESPVSGARIFPQKTPVFLNTFTLRKPTELHIRNIPREKLLFSLDKKDGYKQCKT